MSKEKLSKTNLYLSFINAILATINLIIFLVAFKKVALIVCILNVCCALVCYNAYKFVEGEGG